jgi:acyl-CoA thioesterase I
MKKWKKVSLIVVLCLGVIAAAVGFWVHSIFEPSLPTVKAHGIKVACVGDSITYGMGVLFNHRSKNSYPALLQSMLGDEYQVLNYGVTNRTLQNSGDAPYTKEKQYASSHEINPDIVIIMLGTNDSKPKNWNAANYEKELKEFADSYKSLPSHPQVYLVKPCAAFDNKMNIDKSVIQNQIVDIINRVADSEGLETIDVFSATKDHPEYFHDGVHPDAAGNKVFAKIVYASLTHK